MEIAADGVTVGEIVSMLGDAEVECIRQGIGPSVFDAAMAVPVNVGVASGPVAAPIFSCVSAVNAAPVATALIVAEIGLSAETADCLVGVLTETPTPHFPITLEAAAAMLVCMSADEAASAAAVFGLAEEEEEEAAAEPEEEEAAPEEEEAPPEEEAAPAEPEEPEAATDVEAPGGLTVGEILAMLDQSEVACVQAQVGPAINAAQGVMVTTEMAGGPIAGPIFGCVSAENGARVATALLAAEIGLSAGTAACVGGVFAAIPGPLFPIPAEAAPEILACMSDDEAARAQSVLGAPPVEEAAPEPEPEPEPEVTATGGLTVGEILAMLDGSEVACVQAQVGPAINAAQGVMVTTEMAGGPIAGPIFGCVSAGERRPRRHGAARRRDRPQRRDGRLRRRRLRRDPRPALPHPARSRAADSSPA